LVDSAGGDLFKISESDWAAIAQRVQAAIKLSAIADEVTQYLPEFKALLSACVQWRDRTHPELLWSAHTLDEYCGQALDVFGSLQDQLSGPLTSWLQLQVVIALKKLGAQTVALNEQFHRVSGEVADFAEINRAVDAKVDKFVDKLGGNWKSILPTTNRVDNAAGRVRGVWQALSADLNGLVSEDIDVTDTFIASLQIQAALAGWTDLQSEARAFLTKSQAVPA
jgi:hypothetical protein